MIIVYNTSQNRFEAILARGSAWRGEYERVKAAGFHFDGERKIWYTPQAAIASRLVEYADESAQEALARARAAVAASHATNADIEVPSPAGLDYLPYQRAGIAYALQREGTLIADEMGLGKTIQAIGIANADPATKNILIICPASIKLNWQREFRKWDVKGLEVGIATSDALPHTNVVIINYDILDRHAESLRARDWDLLIVDECHKAKNPSAKRTQYLLGKYVWDATHKVWRTVISPITARRRLFLTGTPIINRPVELWPLVRALDPQDLGRSKSFFERRYCDARFNGYGYDTRGAANLPELQEKLRAKFMVRRCKADVLSELPPKRREIVVLETDATVAEIVRREQEVYAEFEAARLNGRTPDFQAMATARRNTAVAKIPFVLEHIHEMLESVEKLVVMAHHHEVIDALAAEFGAEAVVVDGRVPADDRMALVDRFQSDPSCKLFIGSIQAAGVGLTLTAASNMVFAELDWTPGNVSQAEDRCHRIGQPNSVLIQYLVLDQSVDARMAETIAKKQTIIAEGLDATTPANESVLR